MDTHRDQTAPPGNDNPPIARGSPEPPAFNVPPVTLAAAGLLVAVFAVLALAPAWWTVAAVDWLAVRPVLVAKALSDPQPVPTLIAGLSLLSHALVHLDGMHVALNVGFLLAFGGGCERAFGTRRYIGILVVAAIAGAMAKLALDWNTPLYLIGASGAVFGCMGAFIRLMIGGSAPMRHRGVILLGSLVIVNFILTFAGPAVFGIDGQIAWDAHVGGFLAGFLLGWPPRPRTMQAAI